MHPFDVRGTTHQEEINKVMKNNQIFFGLVLTFVIFVLRNGN